MQDERLYIHNVAANVVSDPHDQAGVTALAEATGRLSHRAADESRHSEQEPS
jgi:hypothetical protein